MTEFEHFPPKWITLNDR